MSFVLQTFYRIIDCKSIFFYSYASLYLTKAKVCNSLIMICQDISGSTRNISIKKVLIYDSVQKKRDPENYRVYKSLFSILIGFVKVFYTINLIHKFQAYCL